MIAFKVSFQRQSLTLARLEIGREFWADIGVLERQFDGGLQVTHLGATVKAGSIEPVGQDRLIANETGQGIGELQFAASAGFDVCQMLKDQRREDITAHHRQRGRRSLRARLFDNAVDAFGPLAPGGAGHDAIGGCLGAFDLLYCCLLYPSYPADE